MRKTYFIADIHLGEDTHKINNAFFRFLNTLEKEADEIDALYILGDFFEVWIGDDNKTQLSERVAHALRQLSAQGIAIYYIHGNRDFLIKKRYAKACNMTILPEQTVVDLYGTPTLLCHGDELCLDDVDYQKFRRKSRSWWWQALMLAMPLSFRQKKAAEIRARSKESKKQKSLEIMDVNEQEVTRFFDKFSVSQMIHGHTHRPNVHTYNNHNTRYVLGDWYTDLWYLVATQDGLEQIKKPL